MVTEGQPLSDDNASFLRAARGGNLEKVLEYLKANTDINTCNANGLNALHLASKEGHVAVVEELLARGAKIDAATKKGNTALHIASLAGQGAVVKILVEHGSAVNVQSQNGFTPLYMAAQENHDGVVRFLLASGANQSLATEDGFTPLAVALQQGHDKVVAVLLENDTRGKVRLPALHIAAKKDDTKAAGLLLQNDHNPDVTSKSGFTPLHIAAHYGNENIAALLLQRNANVNYAAKHNITPLHVAAKWGKANMVALLLDKGANLEAKTRDGLTPLHCAARSGHENVVDMMVQRGAPISAKTKNGLAPLHMASQGDHVDAARILLHHKAPVDEVTVDYLTALHVAAHCGHVRVAKLLLDRKADPNSRALNGFTPLHIACKKNRIKVVELLLKYGASIEATTESGLTPLHVASFMGCMNIVIYLIQHQASPDEATVRGETPLHLAARANQTDIIRILLRNGAQVDARAREQQTPLHIASRLGNVDIVVLLLQSGAQVDATTKDLYTALHIAAKEGQEEVASVLLEHKASLTATTKKGFTPLHLAAKYGNLKVSRLLLEKDAPVDAEGKNGVTPLHVAAHYDHQNVALLLLDKGASPHASAKNGYTPLHITAKKNQLDIASSLLEYGSKTDAESKAGFTPLHLASQEGHFEMVKVLIKHNTDVNAQAKNGLAPIHLCAQEDRVTVAEILAQNGADLNSVTKAGYSPLHVASHFGSVNMVKHLLEQEVLVSGQNELGYTPLHQAAQQGHSQIVNLLLETGNASPNTVSNNGQTALSIAQRLGYISVVETLKVVTEQEITTTTTTTIEEKYKVLAPESMQETFMSDSEDEGGEENMLGESSYKYLTVDEMKSLGDDSMPIDVTHDEKHQKGEANYQQQQQRASSVMQAAPGSLEEKLAALEKQKDYQSGFNNLTADNVDLPNKSAITVGKLRWRSFLVSFMVDARGGAMRGCRHSGVRVIIPPRKAPMPMRITCRYLKKDKLIHPPPLMEGEAIASRILELGPSGAKFLGPVIIEVPHFASLRGKEREIVILRSDNGETWREHTLEATEEAVQEVLQESFDPDELSQLEDLNTNRITRILTTDFPQYFAIVSRIRQEVHAIGPEGGVVNSTVVPQVQAVFPQGALTKKIKVGLQAHPIPPELTAKLLGNRVAVSPIVTVEPRRRKFHKPITLTIPVPQAAGKGMINQYNGETPTLRLLCSITGGTTRAQWEDVTGSTPLHFVNDCVNFTTTVSARFWLMDCRNVEEATKMATELYREAIHVPFMAKFCVFSKRHELLEARLRVFCMTDDKEEKTLEGQEHFNEIAKSRDVEVLEGKSHFVEMGGNLVPVTKSGDQLSLRFYAFRENRLPFNVRVKDPNSEPLGRIAFMKEPKSRQDTSSQAPQAPICNLNLVLPDNITPELILPEDFQTKVSFLREAGYGKFDTIHKADLKISDIGNLLGSDWVKVAYELEIPDSDINIIKSEYPENEGQQAMVMLRFWLNTQGNKATGNALERALRKCDREDIINKCIFNVELVTDEKEKHQAEEALDLVEEEEPEEEMIPEVEYKQVQEELITEKMEKMTFESGTLMEHSKESTFIMEHEEVKYSAEEKDVHMSETLEEQIEEALPVQQEKSHELSEDERQQPSPKQRKDSSSSSSSSEDADDQKVQAESPEVSRKSPEMSVDSSEPVQESYEISRKSPEVEQEISEITESHEKFERASPVVQTESQEESPEISRKSPQVQRESPELETESHEKSFEQESSTESHEKSPEVSRKSPELETESHEKSFEQESSTESHGKSPEVSRKSPELETESQEKSLEQESSTESHEKSPEVSRKSPEFERKSESSSSESPEPIRKSPEVTDDSTEPPQVTEDSTEPPQVIVTEDVTEAPQVTVTEDSMEPPQVTVTEDSTEAPQVTESTEPPQITRDSPEPMEESSEMTTESFEPTRQIPEITRDSPEPADESSSSILGETADMTESKSVEFSKDSPEVLSRKSPDSDKESIGSGRESPVVAQKSSSESPEPKKALSRSSSSSSEEAGEVKHGTTSEDTTDLSSSKPKDSSSSQQAIVDLRQDTLDEVEDKPAFQIQIATEQEVEPDDFYQVQQQEEEAKLESKTPPPSPIVESESKDLEGAETSLTEAATVASRELEEEASTSVQQSSDDDASKEDEEEAKVGQQQDDSPKEEELSSNSQHPQPPSSTTIDLTMVTQTPSFAKSILANTTTLDDETESSMEFKEIRQTSAKDIFTIDQDSFVTKQIHETMSDEDEAIMESSNLIKEETAPKSKSIEDLDMIKQVATDFVKTLSEEALEIVREKMTPENQLQVPTLEVTFPSDQDISSQTPPEISDQFQFQTSFRAHFVRDFDGINDEVDFVINGQMTQSLDHEENERKEDDLNHQESQDDEKKPESEKTPSSSQSNQMMESSEDIWAGEDAVMLRKSKTTFSIRSPKTDSESASSDLKLKSDRLSGTDQEWSSSGDPYHTAHGSSSRPSSSDVEVMLSAVSGRDSSSMTTTGDYETAHSHADHSSSTYHTAASTLSSKSFSDKSGHLASFEHSETSDTLIDISIEPEDDRDQACTPSGQEETILPHDDEPSLSNIVRSPEMFFNQDRQNLTGSVVTISSASETATVIQQQDIIEVKKEEEVMIKSTVLTESTSSSVSEKAIISCETGSGEILSTIEELKKDESPCSESKSAHQITRVVSFDTSNLEMTSQRSGSSFRDQKSFDSDFGSRPESELKDFESRPHSISEAMLDEQDRSRPTSKGDASDTEMDNMKKNLDPFQRPDSPEPPMTDSSPMDEKSAKTELAFSTHFTQVIEDEEFEKLDEVPEYQVMTAVDIEEDKKLRVTKSFDSEVVSASPPTGGKPLGAMVWPGSDGLNIEDGEKEPVGKRNIIHSESEEEEGMKPATVNIEDDDWDETDPLVTREPRAAGADEGDFVQFGYVPPLDQIIEEEEEINEELQKKELQNLKESLSSTPEFEMIADRRALSLKLGEKDNSSLSSLQEFETLEREMVHTGSGSGSRNSLGSADSLEMGGPVKIPAIIRKTHSKPSSSHGSSGSLQEFEQMEDACQAAESLESTAKIQENVLSEIEEGHESQISESESCETLSQGGKSDDSEEFTQRMHQIDEIIRQAQTNVETFDRPQQYLSCIMEASTDSLEAGRKELIPSMVTSTDSLEDKLQHSNNGDDLMKISTDSIEQNKRAIEVSGASAMMIASTDSLESGSTNTKATASMLSSYASHTSDTFVSGYDSGLERLIESTDESTISIPSSTTVTTSQCMVSYGFNVSEVILPTQAGGMVSTIERTVEMPAEVTKIQFKGPNAESKMKEYVDSISGGKSLQEVESVDASGNVIHKRVIQQRLYSEEH